METLEFNNKTIAVNEEGYLKDSAQWSPELAHQLAKDVNISLTDKHFQVLNWLIHKVIKQQNKYWQENIFLIPVGMTFNC